MLYRLQLLQLVPNFRRHRDLGEREKSTHHGSNATMGDFSLAHYDLISQHNGRSRSRSRPTDRPTDAHPLAHQQQSPVRQNGWLRVVQPPSKGSLRGSKCTPLCNSQLPACKPIVCRGSQVSKSYIDAEQRHQRSSILDTCCMTPRARALSACMQ